MRGMHRSERDVAEDRPFRHGRDRVAHHLHGLVDDVGRQVVAFRRGRRRIDEVVVLTEFGVELIGLAQEEAVVPIEPPSERPMGERPRRRRVPDRGEVPLPRRNGREALSLQDFCDRGGFGRHRAGHVGEAAVPMRDPAHAHRVMVASRQQRGPRRRAQRRGVKPAESQSARRQAVHVRRGDDAAVARQMGESRVVEQHDDDVGGARRGHGDIGPVRLRLRPGSADPAAPVRRRCVAQPALACRVPFASIASASIASASIVLPASDPGGVACYLCRT